MVTSDMPPPAQRRQPQTPATPVASAFWLHPDWSGGDNLRDPGTAPFWMLAPRPAEPITQVMTGFLTTPRRLSRSDAKRLKAQFDNIRNFSGVIYLTPNEMRAQISMAEAPPA